MLAGLVEAPVLQLLPLLLFAACAKNDGVPAWAMDPIWLEPDGDGVYGFQTWELFSQPWGKKLDEAYYVCGIVVELTGTPATIDAACPGCVAAWDIETALLETDCAADAGADDPAYLSLRRVALGDVPADLQATDPYPHQSHGGYADYGTGTWETHGWAYPDALDTRGQATDTDWNGEQAFQWWPAYVWDLGGP